MKQQYLNILPLALTLLLSAGCASGPSPDVEAGYDEDAGSGPQAMAHVRHVAVAWAGTPSNAGLLTVARKEAQRAQKHADLALQRAGDSDWVKMHAAHLQQILAPEQRAGAGTGYGLIPAVKGVKKHIGLAMQQDDASDAVAFHGEQITLSSDSVLARSQMLKALADRVLAAPRHTDFRAEAARMSDLAGAILSGEDLNDDGIIDWEANEAGLDQSLKYVDYLLQKEIAAVEE